MVSTLHKLTTAWIDKQVYAHELWLSSAGLEGRKAVFIDADLSGYDFRGKNMSQAEFYNCSLQNCDCTCTRFNKAAIVESDLSGALLHYTCFKGANLEGTTITAASILGATAPLKDTAQLNKED